MPRCCSPFRVPMPKGSSGSALSTDGLRTSDVSTARTTWNGAHRYRVSRAWLPGLMTTSILLPLEPEPPPDLIDQLPLVRTMHWPRAVRERHEHRRVHRR